MGSVKEFSGAISGYDTSINRELFKNHFSYQRPTTMLKSIDTTKNTKKNNKLVNLIQSGLSDLRDEIDNIFEDKIRIEKLDKIVDIAEKIFDFNI